MVVQRPVSDQQHARGEPLEPGLADLQDQRSARDARVDLGQHVGVALDLEAGLRALVQMKLPEVAQLHRAEGRHLAPLADGQGLGHRRLLSFPRHGSARGRPWS